MNINIILLFIYSLGIKMYGLISIKSIISILYNFFRKMDIQPNISHYGISHFLWSTKYAKIIFLKNNFLRSQFS